MSGVAKREEGEGEAGMEDKKVEARDWLQRKRRSEIQRQFWTAMWKHLCITATCKIILVQHRAGVCTKCFVGNSPLQCES